MKYTVSVVVPVYFNAPSLPLLHEAMQGVEAQLNTLDCALQLVFVDDGSRDDSLAELLKIKHQRPENTTVVKLARNFGSVVASKTGLRYVTGDCFMWIAADLQEPPQLIVDMVQEWLAGHKYVICRREKRDDPLQTVIFSRVYYRLLRLFVVPNYPEGGFDLALMDKSLLAFIRDSSKNINTPLLSYWLGYPPKVLAYHRQARKHGRSGWTFGKRVNFFLDSLLGFSKRPMRLFSSVGATVALLGFGYGLYIVTAAILGRRGDLPGFPTLIAIITFLQGINMLMLGVMGEYLWRIFDEVNKRPESVVDEVY